MADNVIRRDVVQIGFDIEESPVARINETIAELRAIASGSVGAVESAFEGITQTAREASNGVETIADSVAELGNDTPVQELEDEIEQVTSSARECEARISEMAKSLARTVAGKIRQLPTVIHSSATAARNFASALRAKVFDAAIRGATKLRNGVRAISRIRLTTLTQGLKNSFTQSITSVKALGRSIVNGLDKGLGKAVLNAKKLPQFLKATVVTGTVNAVNKLKTKFLEAARAAKEVKEETNKTETTLEKCKNAANGLKGALAGALAGLGVAQATSGVAGLQSSMNKFQAQTGVSTKEMAAYSESIKSLYTDAMGESMEDVSNSMAIVKQTTGMVGKELEATTHNALLMRDTFDFDIQESIRSVDMMMKHFGVSADEAYSMIAQGAQNGLNKNGDLLDTVNEYSVHFKKLGFSSDEMFNMLVNGAESGTFSVDKLGDTIKEFGIRVVDGSDSTAEGFATIGLSASEMAKKFSAGGETSKQAFAETVEALKSMKDPIAQDAAGVQLFGTMWEDLGAEGVFALSQITGEVTNSTDALKQINEVRYDDVGSALEALKRKGIVAMNTALTPILNKVIQLINKFQEWANKIGLVDKIKAAFDRVKNAAQPIVDNVIKVGKAILNFATAESTIEKVKAAFDRVKNVIDPIVSVVQRVVAEITKIATSETTINLLKDAFEGIKTVFDGIFTAAEKVFTFIKDNIEWILPLVKGLVIAFTAYKVIMLAIKGAVIAYNIVQGIMNALMAVSPVMWIVIIIGLLIGAIILLIKNWDKVKEVAANVWEKIKGVWGTVKAWFTANVITPIVTKFNEIKAKALAIWTAIKTAAVTVFTAIVTWINMKITQIKTFFTNLVTAVTTIFNSIKTAISNAITTVVTWIQGRIEAIKGFFSGLWLSVTTIFSNVVSFFSEKFSAAVEAIKSVFGTVVGFFQGIWDNIKEMFTKIGTTIGNGIADAFATVVNAVIGFAENTINGFIRAINTAIGLINEIPGVEISTISELSIPRLAKGGIVDKPTIAEIGEDGREAVVPLENNTEWLKSLAKYIPNGNYVNSYDGSEKGSTTSYKEYNEYNEYSPHFTVVLNGASATDDNKRKVKGWIKESFKEMFDDLDRNNEPIIEV